MNDTTDNAAKIDAAIAESVSAQIAPSETTEAVKTEKTPKQPTMEVRMLEMLLKEKHPDTLDKALANGKTVAGAWNYVVSVMKNAYISEHGRVSGGMCGNPDVVVSIAERYLREFDEGYVEPEIGHSGKKSNPKAEAKKAVVDTAKAAAKAAKAEAKRKTEELRKAWADRQMTLF